MEESIKYTSFLRIYRDYCIYDDKFADLCDYLRRYKTSVSEITFFNSKVHSVQKLFVTEEFAEAFKQRLPILHDIGIRVGINVHPTVGFFEQGGDLKYTGAPFSVNSDGGVQIGSICPTDDRSLEYITQLYTIIANAHPDFLYVDDDIKMQANSICFCSGCIEKFENSTHAFSKRGFEANAENNRHLLGEADFYREWIYFNTKNVGNMYSLIEKTVHDIIPNAELGLMTCCSPLLKSEIAYYADCLKGSLLNIRTRPGGGLYSDARIGEIVEKTVSIASQNLNLPSCVTKIEAEIENFPSQSMRKSCRYMELEIMNYLAVGCTGIAYNIFENSATLNEHASKWEMIKALTPYAKEYVELFGRSEPIGINLLCGFTDTDDVVRKRNYLMELPEQFAYLGVPICYNTDNATAFIITDKAAQILDDNTLKKAFKNGVFISGTALEILNNRGLSEYTGFKINNVYAKDTYECDIPCELNLQKTSQVPYTRDGMQAFSWFPEYRKSYSIEAVGRNPIYMTELSDYSGNKLGYSMGICENKIGGKVCVSGYFADSFCECYARKHQLRYVLDWLSNGTLKAYIESNHKIILFDRQNHGKNGLTLINMSLDDAENVIICIRNCVNRDLKLRYYYKGKILEAPLKFIRERGNTTLFSLSLLPELSAGYITT